MLLSPTGASQKGNLEAKWRAEKVGQLTAARSRLDVATVAHAATRDRVTDGVLVAAHVIAAARRAHVQRRHYNMTSRFRANTNKHWR